MYTLHDALCFADILCCWRQKKRFAVPLPANRIPNPDRIMQRLNASSGATSCHLPSPPGEKKNREPCKRCPPQHAPCDVPLRGPRGSLHDDDAPEKRIPVLRLHPDCTGAVARRTARLRRPCSAHPTAARSNCSDWHLPGSDTRHVKRNVNDHVFLSTHHATTAEFDEDFARIDAVVGAGLLCVAQEARIDAGIA